MTEWEAWVYTFNGAAGVVLLVFGALAFFHPKGRRLALPLYLTVLGAQIILSNAAGYAKESAFWLFLLGNLFYPLQGFLLLVYAYQQAGQNHPKIQQAAKIGAFIALACAVAGTIAVFVPGSDALTVNQREDGLYAQERGNWALLFQAPQFLGGSLALLLLTVPTSPEDRRNWTLLTGLIILVGYSYAWSFSYESNPGHVRSKVLFELGPQVSFTVIASVLAAALLLVAAAAIHLLIKAQGAGKLPKVQAALALGALLAIFAERPSELPWFAFSQGPWRLLAAWAFLFPALFLGHTPAEAKAPVPTTKRPFPLEVPLWGAVICAVVAAIVFVFAQWNDVSDEWTATAAGLSALSFVIILSLTVPPALGELLLPKDTLAER